MCSSVKEDTLFEGAQRFDSVTDTGRGIISPNRVSSSRGSLSGGVSVFLSFIQSSICGQQRQREERILEQSWTFGDLSSWLFALNFFLIVLPTAGYCLVLKIIGALRGRRSWGAFPGSLPRISVVIPTLDALRHYGIAAVSLPVDNPWKDEITSVLQDAGLTLQMVITGQEIWALPERWR